MVIPVTSLGWPLPALIVWASGWLSYGFLLSEDVPAAVAMLLSALTGLAASAVAWTRGYSMARLLALAERAGARVLGAVTPIGGMLMIAGWAVLLWGALAGVAATGPPAA